MSQPPPDPACIFFGAWVSLEDEAGRSVRYRLVGADETDMDNGHISIDSVLARALLKRRIDEEISVRTPQGESRYLIVDVQYIVEPSAGGGDD